MKNFFKTYYRQKLRSSSIIEVIIALIICLIIFAISSSILLKSNKNDNATLKYKAYFLLSSVQQESLDEYKKSPIAGISLSTEKEENDTLNNVYKITVTAHSYTGRLLGEKIFLLEAPLKNE